MFLEARLAGRFPAPCRCDRVLSRERLTWSIFSRDFVLQLQIADAIVGPCLRRLVPGRGANVVPDSPRGVPSPTVGSGRDLIPLVADWVGAVNYMRDISSQVIDLLR